MANYRYVKVGQIWQLDGTTVHWLILRGKVGAWECRCVKADEPNRVEHVGALQTWGFDTTSNWEMVSDVEKMTTKRDFNVEFEQPGRGVLRISTPIELHVDPCLPLRINVRELSSSFEKPRVVSTCELRAQKIYHIGNRFKLQNFDEEGEWLLVSTSKDTAALVNTKTGSRWAEAVPVNDFFDITHEEMRNLAGDEEFLLLEE